MKGSIEEQRLLEQLGGLHTANLPCVSNLFKIVSLVLDLLLLSFEVEIFCCFVFISIDTLLPFCHAILLVLMLLELRWSYVSHLLFPLMSAGHFAAVANKCHLRAH